MTPPLNTGNGPPWPNFPDRSCQVAHPKRDFKAQYSAMARQREDPSLIDASLYADAENRLEADAPLLGAVSEQPVSGSKRKAKDELGQPLQEKTKQPSQAKGQSVRNSFNSNAVL